MATLYLPSNTTALIGNGTSGSLATTTSPTTYTISGSGNTAGASLLIIYKGSVPSFPAFTDRNTRASDVLITFSSGTGTASYSNLGIISLAYRMLIGKMPTSTTATASGTAAWFLLCRSGTTSLTDKGSMIGTVGITGSGADLELPSLDIISGSDYQSAGFYINMPQTFTVP